MGPDERDDLIVVESVVEAVGSEDDEAGGAGRGGLDAGGDGEEGAEGLFR